MVDEYPERYIPTRGLISHVIHARAHYVIQCVMDFLGKRSEDVFPNFNATNARLFPHFQIISRWIDAKRSMFDDGNDVDGDDMLRHYG